MRPNSVVLAAVRDIESSGTKALHDLPRGDGSRLVVLKIDSSSLTDAEQAVSLLKSKYNIQSLDVVIANAGISKVWPAVHEAKIEDIREHFEINVLGIVTLFKAVRPLLLRSTNTPKFITLGSTAGWLENMDQILYPNAAYGTSKAALHWITKKIHQENSSLVVFPIHPGWVQTELGNTGAQAFGLEKAFITIEESINGVLNVFGYAGNFEQWKLAPEALRTGGKKTESVYGVLEINFNDVN
ncbi:hypothetical protein LTR10_022654 [Elasticomyces elasticus]|uniref:Uncharacterized protein n=1 Tax=Exophiala sideris TaxID=1016849 RepID=A0ABR0IY99_9EURO|nr:hypothetical protein LTR10_022654 [Elasticomyces elasticus]KAK5021906.1 hypothetical protein LTS07_010488 [Exophiala sideris]KAK5025969.1 hypothetical protein LTR13_010126 [Exophiala sideris]KAK5050656.1 hypothetical protein LTR69_010512 [Exophiala sideris]KAK5177141.1 hypothetical protein LTR44_010269 [Eurotiomycetes sp. CCFEE 6388]